MTSIESPNYNFLNNNQIPSYDFIFNNINNFITMQTMLQNNMNNMNNFNPLNGGNSIPSFGYSAPMNFMNNTSFMPNMMQNNFPMNNSMNNNMVNTMKDFQLNNNMIMNNINNMNNMNNFNNTMNINNCMPNNNNITNSMINIQPSSSMNNSINNININNTNQNMMMNNNMINQMNMNMNYNNNMNCPNCSNCPNNNFNMMNNYFNNNINCYDPMNLSNSFNNVLIPTNSDDFSFWPNMSQLNLLNTCILNDVNIVFVFTNTKTFNVSGKFTEKLSQIIDRFKVSHPEIVKGKLLYCLHMGLKLDTEKTLKELKINNGDRVLFILEEEKTDNEKKNKEKVNIDLNTLNKYTQIGLMIKEHIHNLVYCLNNFTWKCNLCKFKYEKNFPKYFCSLCNFSMCEKCHDIRNYPKFKAFPEDNDNSKIDITKKFFKTIYHKHILVYSRTSRDQTELKQWYCDNCKENFENNVWSFYCTKCDYDLCKKCAGFT